MYLENPKLTYILEQCGAHANNNENELAIFVGVHWTWRSLKSNKF